MLSKSQAKAFFVGGTAMFTAIFLYLTVDTMYKVPEQTRSQNISEEVKRGKELWDKNNCMGCHTILGEGAYYAPELTKAYTRRGAEWLKIFLRDPEKMFPGERKMVQYNFTDAQIGDVVAFLKWVSEMNLNGFPKEPTIKLAAAAAAGAPSRQAPEKFTQVCTACHALDGKGGNVGPALDGVGKRFNADYLDKWIGDPQAVKPGTAMPNLGLSAAEREELVRFLATLQ